MDEELYPPRDPLLREQGLSFYDIAAEPKLKSALDQTEAEGNAKLDRYAKRYADSYTAADEYERVTQQGPATTSTVYEGVDVVLPTAPRSARESVFEAELYKRGAKDDAKLAEIRTDALLEQQEAAPKPEEPKDPFDQRELRLSRGEYLSPAELEQHYDQSELDPRKVLARNKLKDTPETRTQLAFREYLIKRGDYEGLDSADTSTYNDLQKGFVEEQVQGTRDSVGTERQALIAQGVGRKSTLAENALRREQLKAIDAKVDRAEAQLDSALAPFATNFYREFDFESSGGGAIGTAPKKDAARTNRDEGREPSAAQARSELVKAERKQAEDNGSSASYGLRDSLINGAKTVTTSIMALVGPAANLSDAATKPRVKAGDELAEAVLGVEKWFDEKFTPESKRQLQNVDTAMKGSELDMLTAFVQNPRAAAILATGAIGSLPSVMLGSMYGGPAGGVAAATAQGDVSSAKVYGKVLDLPIEGELGLKSNAIWYDTKARMGGSPDDEAVRQRIASDARLNVTGYMYLIAASTALAGGRASGITLEKAATDGLLRASGRAGAREAIGEGLQGYSEELVSAGAVDAARGGTGELPFSSQEARNQALVGGILGFGVGAVAPGAERLATRVTTRTAVPTTMLPPDQQVQGGLDLPINRQEYLRGATNPDNAFSPAALERKFEQQESFAARQEARQAEVDRVAAREQLNLIDEEGARTRTENVMAASAAELDRANSVVESTRAKREEAYNAQTRRAFVDQDPLAGTRRRFAESTTQPDPDQVSFNQSMADIDYNNALKDAEFAQEAHTAGINLVYAETYRRRDEGDPDLFRQERPLQQDDMLRARREYRFGAPDPVPLTAEARLLAKQAANAKTGEKFDALLAQQDATTAAFKGETPAKPATQVKPSMVAATVVQQIKSKANPKFTMLESRASSEPRASIDEQTLSAVVKDFNLASNRFKVQQVDTVADAPDAVNERAQGYVKLSPDRNDAEIVLIRENIPDIATARAVMTEEAINHAGVLGLLDEGQLAAVYGRMFQAIEASSDLQAGWKTVQQEYAGETPATQNAEMLSYVLNNPQLAAAKAFAEGPFRRFISDTGLPGTDAFSAQDIKTIRDLGELNSQNPNAEGARSFARRLGLGIVKNYAAKRQQLAKERGDFLALTKGQETYDSIFSKDGPTNRMFEFIAQSPVANARELADGMRNALRAVPTRAQNIHRDRVMPVLKSVTENLDALNREAKAKGFNGDVALQEVDKYMVAKHASEQNFLTQVYEASFIEQFKENRPKVTALLNEVRDLGAAMTVAQRDGYRTQLRALVNDGTVTDAHKVNTPDSSVSTLGNGLNNVGAQAKIRDIEGSQLFKLPAFQRQIEILKTASAVSRGLLVDLGRVDAAETGNLFDMTHYMPQKGGDEAATAKTGSITDYAASTRDRRQTSRSKREEPATNQTGEMIAQLSTFALDLGRQKFDRAMVGLATATGDAYASLVSSEPGKANLLVTDMRDIVTITPNVRFRHTDEGLRLFNADGTPAKKIDPRNTVTVLGEDGSLNTVHLKAGELVRALDPKATRIALGMDKAEGAMATAGGYMRQAVRASSMNMTTSPEFFRTSFLRDGYQLLAEGAKTNGLKGMKDAGAVFTGALMDGGLALAQWGAQKATIGGRLGSYEAGPRASNVARNYDMEGLAALKASNPPDFAKGGKHEFLEEFVAKDIVLSSPDVFQTRSGLATALETNKSLTANALSAARSGLDTAIKAVRTPFETLEYGIRYAHYVVARKSGMGPEEAGQYAINQIDFANKSEVGQKLNAWLAFSQTALNGVRSMAENRVYKEGRAPVTFVKQLDGTRKQVSTLTAGDISKGGVASSLAKLSGVAASAATMPVMGLMVLAQLAGGSDDNGISNYAKEDADVTANNMLIPIGGGKFSRVPFQDGVIGLLGGTTVTLTRMLQGHFSANEAARVLYNLTRRHAVPLGRSDISEDDLRRTGTSGVLAGLAAAFTAQANALIPQPIQPLAGAYLNRDSFGRESSQTYDAQTGGTREIPGNQRNALEKKYTEVSAKLKADYAMDIPASTVRAFGDTFAQVLPFGLNATAALRNSDRVEGSRDPDSLDADGTPGVFKYLTRLVLRESGTGRGYEYRQYRDFVDDNVRPLQIQIRGAADLDKLDASRVTAKGQKATGNAVDAFRKAHPELAEYTKVEGARREIAGQLNAVYRKAMVEGDNRMLAQVNKARAEVSVRTLDAMGAIKEGRFAEGKKTIDGLKSLVPR